MTDTRIADVSEFQGHIDWAAYAESAVIIRALYGTSHVDLCWEANIAGARANKSIRCRGIYAYIVASQDITAQANAFVRTVQRLLPGEFVIADIEEGSGDLQPRFETWAGIVHQALGGTEGEYSGAAFAAAHLEGFKGARFAWVAAYQSNEPTIGHQMWQSTDAERFAGIASPCDGSIFHGSIDNLLALIGATSTAPVSSAPAAGSFPLEVLMSLAKSPEDEARAAGRTFWAFYTNEAPDEKTLQIIVYEFLTSGAEAGVTACEDSPLAQKVRAARIARDGG